MSEFATDILLEYKGEPKALDDTLQAMPGCVGALVMHGPVYVKIEDYYVFRLFNGSVRLFKMMVEAQGYCTVVRALEELV